MEKLLKIDFTHLTNIGMTFRFLTFSTPTKKAMAHSTRMLWENSSLNGGVIQISKP